jgi:hypothetical protein
MGWYLVDRTEFSCCTSEYIFIAVLILVDMMNSKPKMIHNLQNFTHIPFGMVH